MTKANDRLRILLVEDDDLLLSDAAGLNHPGIEFLIATHARVTASKGALDDCEAIVMSIDAPGALDLVADLAGRKDTPPVVALGALGAHGRSLEHMLTLAELRGAALSLPKPIDAIELVLAVLGVMKRVAPDGKIHASTLKKDLERRLVA